MRCTPVACSYKKQSAYIPQGRSHCFFWDKNKTHTYSVSRIYSFWMLNLLVHQAPSTL